jgi:HSP20 family protein
MADEQQYNQQPPRRPPEGDDERQFDPLKELNNLRSSAGRLIEQGIQSVQKAAGGAMVRLDVYELDNEVVIRTNALDGLSGDSIEVSMEGSVLTIRGETQPEDTHPKASYFLQERKFGSFSRSVTIPIPVKSKQASAKLKNNILTVRLPVDTERYQDITVTPAE